MITDFFGWAYNTGTGEEFGPGTRRYLSEDQKAEEAAILDRYMAGPKFQFYNANIGAARHYLGYNSSNAEKNLKVMICMKKKI